MKLFAWPIFAEVGVAAAGRGRNALKHFFAHGGGSRIAHWVWCDVCNLNPGEAMELPPATLSADKLRCAEGLTPVSGGIGRDVFPPLVSDLYREAPSQLRLKILNCLLRPVGPLALVAVAAGAFSSLLPVVRWQQLTVSLDDTLRIDAGQVLELARYVDQKSPEVFQQIGALLCDGPTVVSTLSSSLLLLALRAWMNRTAPGREP
jgi:hypothetical protein